MNRPVPRESTNDAATSLRALRPAGSQARSRATGVRGPAVLGAFSVVTVGSDPDEAHQGGLGAPVVPGVPCAELDDTGARGDQSLLAVVEFQVDLALQTDPVVQGVGGVQRGPAGLEDVHEAGEA